MRFLLGFLAAGLLAGSAEHASQVIDPPPTVGPMPPPEAIAAGMTRLVHNSDFSQAFSSDCNGTTNPQWFHTRNGLLLGDCQSLIWPATDQGHTVLDIHFDPNDEGSAAGRQGVISEASDSQPSNSYPIRMFTEARLRMTVNTTPTHELNPLTDAEMGPWQASWKWFQAINPGGPMEEDDFEAHLGTPNGQNSGSLVFNWGVCGGSCGGLPFIATIAGNWNWTNQQYNPSAYHDFGARLTTPPVSSCQVPGPNKEPAGTYPCLQEDTFIDHNLILSTQTTLTPDEAVGRFINMITVSSGCNGPEGDATCLNLPVTATNDAGGKLSLTINDGGTRLGCTSSFFHCWDNGALVYVSSVGGNVPDGTYYWSLNAANDVHLTPRSGGSEVPFSGGYTGSGTINPVSSIDTRVQYYRVWVPAGCTNWRTTECGGGKRERD